MEEKNGGKNSLPKSDNQLSHQEIVERKVQAKKDRIKADFESTRLILLKAEFDLEEAYQRSSCSELEIEKLKLFVEKAQKDLIRLEQKMQKPDSEIRKQVLYAMGRRIAQKNNSEALKREQAQEKQKEPEKLVFEDKSMENFLKFVAVFIIIGIIFLLISMNN